MRIVPTLVLSTCLSNLVVSLGCSGTEIPPPVSPSGGQVGIVLWPSEPATGKNRILAAILLRDPSTADVKLLDDSTTELRVTFTQRGTNIGVSATTGLDVSEKKTEFPFGTLGHVPYSHFIDVEFPRAGKWVADIIVRSSSIPRPVNQRVELTVVPRERDDHTNPL
jgi:hypothetical protein